MTTFLIGLAMLIIGGIVYGRFAEKVFQPDDRETPAIANQDGVDYVPMDKKKNALIELLNIAGTGPILGPIQGILFGPLAFILIPIGCVLGGAVHDYMSGMISIRSKGEQMPALIKRNLGGKVYSVYNIFVIVLMILVGAVFIYTPGDLIVANVLHQEAVATNPMVWIVYACIFAYYIIATLFPIDKIIGRVYPFFAVLLVFMAVGLLGALAFKGYTFYSNIEWTMHSPSGLPAWPLVFITIACGACSGFHATQSPLMARCINNEKHGRKIFYGAMIAEGVIGLIWVTLGMSFYSDYDPQESYGTVEGTKDRPEDGAKTGNVQQLDQKHLGRAHLHIVHTVRHFAGRRGAVGIRPEHLFHNGAIHTIPSQQPCQGQHKIHP